MKEKLERIKNHSLSMQRLKANEVAGFTRPIMKPFERRNNDS